MKAYRIQSCGAYFVFGTTYIMLTPVEFDDQLERRRTKIHDIGTDWMLSTKGNAFHLARP